MQTGQPQHFPPPFHNFQQTQQALANVAADYELKRRYLALLPPQQIIEICLTFDVHVPPYIKNTIWPGDLNAAIGTIQGQGSSKQQQTSQTNSSTSQNVPPKRLEIPLMDSLFNEPEAEKNPSESQSNPPPGQEKSPPPPPPPLPTPTTATPTTIATTAMSRLRSPSVVAPTPPPIIATPSPTPSRSSESVQQQTAPTPAPASTPVSVSATSTPATQPAPAPPATLPPQPSAPVVTPTPAPPQLGYPHAPYGFSAQPTYPHTPYYPGQWGTYPIRYPFPPGVPFPFPHATSAPGSSGASGATAGPSQPSQPSTSVPGPPITEGPTPSQNGDELPSYEDMIVEVLGTLGEDSEGMMPKDLWSWMASRYPLQQNFRPSAGQALGKAYKKGRLEKSESGRYRLNPQWKGGSTTRKGNRRPQLQAPSGTSSSHSRPPPFTNTPLIRGNGSNLTTPNGQPMFGYGNSAAGTSASGNASTSEDNAEIGDAFEAAKHILKAINFGSLLSMDENDGGAPEMSEPGPSTSSDGPSTSAVDESIRAELQAQLALLAVQLNEIMQEPEPEPVLQQPPPPPPPPPPPQVPEPQNGVVVNHSSSMVAPPPPLDPQPPPQVEHPPPPPVQAEDVETLPDVSISLDMMEDSDSDADMDEVIV